MVGNDRMETASMEVTSIRCRNDIEKSTWKIHRYFVDFQIRRIQVEISTSNRCHNFHVNSPFKIDENSTNFPRGIWTSNQWRIDKDVSIRLAAFSNISLETSVPNLVSLTCPSLQILGKTQTGVFLISGFLVNPL